MFTDAKKQKVANFLIEKGAKKFTHIKQRSLFEHLTRVGNLLESWGVPEYVVHAGMCHSLYATEFFKTAILSIDEREELRKLIGTEAESLVYDFCSAKRNTFQRNENGSFTIESHVTSRVISLEEVHAIMLLHLFLANDIDHIDQFNVQSTGARFVKVYGKWLNLFLEPARKYVMNISVHPTLRASQGNFIRFIAHAGVQIVSDGVSCVIDPWLYPSTHANALLRSIDPGSNTIDFLIPEPRNDITDLESDIILLSHFHTHHSPLQEITELVRMRPVQIVCPELGEEKLTKIRTNLGEEIFNRITFHQVTVDTELQFENITVRCITHLSKGHLAFFVDTKQGRVLHLADPRAQLGMSLEFDTLWDKFDGLKPDYAFVSCAGHILRHVNEKGEREILEHTSFSPTQCAKFMVKIGAKAGGAIGIFNHSIWTERVEFTHSSEAIEKEFFWALSFLAPSIRILTVRPGDIFYFDEKVKIVAEK
jgi:L-ascorbate metabolism protein UlaG (beta-lactamase superfamily)